jgi:hypothetical protein
LHRKEEGGCLKGRGQGGSPKGGKYLNAKFALIKACVNHRANVVDTVREVCNQICPVQCDVIIIKKSMNFGVADAKVKN